MRGYTRAQLAAAATAGQLAAGEPYLITDENRIAVGTGATTYQDYAKLSEAGSGAAGLVVVRNNGSTVQSVPTATWTKLTTALGVVVTNENGWDVANSRFQPTVAGTYLVDLLAGVNHTAGSWSVIYAALYFNGANLAMQHSIYANGMGPSNQHVSAVIRMNGTTDKIECYLYHSATVAENTLASSTGMRFSACRLGD